MTDRAARLARVFAPVITHNLETATPYLDVHLWRAGERGEDASTRHPAFGNSFDWHSSVHSHATGLQLLSSLTAGGDGAGPDATALHAAMSRTLTPANLKIERAYLAANAAYERPYGWAWAVRLAGVAATHGAAAGLAESAAPLRALAETVAELAMAWAEALPEPVRHGVHSNTAFALTQLIRGARDLARHEALDGPLTDLEPALTARARAWFGADRDWPGHAERSGNDFLSPALAEAELMALSLPPAEFSAWWGAFLPGLRASDRVLAVIDVPDIVDGHIGHLHGLNLSRGAALARVLTALRHEDARAAAPADASALDDLTAQAVALHEAGLRAAVHGDYLLTHWLATFAWEGALALDALEA